MDRIDRALERIRRETVQEIERLDVAIKVFEEMYDDDHATAKAFDLMARTFSFFDPNKG